MLKLSTRQLIRSLGIVLLCISAGHILPVAAKDKEERNVWTGTLYSGKVLTEDDLRQILDQHEKWLYTYGKEGYSVSVKSGQN